MGNAGAHCYATTTNVRFAKVDNKTQIDGDLLLRCNFILHSNVIIKSCIDETMNQRQMGSAGCQSLLWAALSSNSKSHLANITHTTVLHFRPFASDANRWTVIVKARKIFEGTQTRWSFLGNFIDSWSTWGLIFYIIRAHSWSQSQKAEWASEDAHLIPNPHSRIETLGRFDDGRQRESYEWPRCPHVEDRRQCLKEWDRRMMYLEGYMKE